MKIRQLSKLTEFLLRFTCAPLHFTNRPGLVMFCLCGLCLFTPSSHATDSTNTRVFNIAILTDGVSEQTDLLTRVLKSEIADIAGQDFDPQYPPSLQRNGDWNADKVHQELAALNTNPNVDLIITLGVIASRNAVSITPIKPVIAPFVIDAPLQGFPVSESGTSGRHNLHYLSANYDVGQEIIAFQQAVGASHIGVLVDSLIEESIPAFSLKLAELSSQAQFTLSAILVTPDQFDIPTSIDAVFVLPQFRFSSDQIQQLIKYINKLGIPSYSIEGRKMVESGVLMGKPLIASGARISRQLAVDVRDIVLGRNAGDLPVSIGVGGTLLLNRETARKINYSPPFTLLFESEVLKELDSTLEAIELEATIAESLQRNLSYIVAKQDLLSVEQDTKIARADLLPQLSVGVSGLSSDQNSSNFGDTRSSNANLSFSQSIYSESVRANYAIAKRLEKAEIADLETTRLDVIQDTAKAYFNVLSAKTEVNIQKDNLRVTRANLQRAKFKTEIGAADRSGIFRFESELGRNRQDVNRTFANYQQAANRLNQILHYPIERQFQTVEPSIQAVGLFDDQRLTKFVNSPQQAQLFRDFLVHRALSNYPEIISIDEQIAAQKRVLLAAKRARYVPDVTLTASGDRLIEDYGSDFPLTEDEDWSIRLQFSLPLYLGSQLKANKSQSENDLHRLQNLRSQLIDNIETSIRIAVHDAGASKVNIEFANESAHAAEQALLLVTDSYNQGAASDAELIDAQNSALVAQLSSSNAFYQFLSDLIDLERAIGAFGFSATPEEKENWLLQLEEYANQHSAG